MSHPQLAVATGHYHLTHRMPMWSAIRKGWYEEEDLEVTLPVTGLDERTEEGIIAGEFPVAFDLRTNRVLRLMAKGAELRIIGGYRNAFPFDFIGPKGATSVADLRGKRIALAEPGGIGPDHVFKAIRSAGLDPDRDVEFKVVGMTPDSVKALRRGEVDAVYVWPHYGAELVKEGYSLLLNFAEVLSRQERVNVVRVDFLERYPDTISAYLRGLIRGCRFVNDASRNFDEISSLLRALADVDIAYGGERAEEAEENLRYHDDPREIINFPFPHDGGVNEPGLQVAMEEEQESGPVPKDWTVDRIAELSSVKQAARDVDARFGPGGYQ